MREEKSNLRVNDGNLYLEALSRDPQVIAVAERRARQSVLLSIIGRCLPRAFIVFESRHASRRAYGFPILFPAQILCNVSDRPRIRTKGHMSDSL